MQTALKPKIFAFLNSLLFLGTMVGLIIWAEQFIPKYAGYSLDFIALALTAFVFRFGENYLRELQSSLELFFFLLVGKRIKRPCAY
jgi:hypothetical protein